MCGQMIDGWNELFIDAIYENDRNMPNFTVRLVGHFDEQPINVSQIPNYSGILWFIQREAGSF